MTISMEGVKVVVSDEDIAAFKDWLKQEPSAPDDLEETIIRCYIVFQRGNLHEAKKRYLNFRRAMLIDPSLLGSGDLFDEKMVAFHRIAALCYLPKKTPEGFTVFVLKLLTAETNDFTWQLARMRYFYMVMYFIQQGDFGNCEILCVFDLAMSNLGHVASFTPEILSQFVTGLRICPLRIKGIIYTKMPTFAEILLKIVRAGLPEKISKRVRYVPNHEELFELIPKEILPSDFGGNELSTEEIYNDQLMKMQQMNHRFLEEVAGLNEHRKLLDLPSISEIETFRKLEID